MLTDAGAADTDMLIAVTSSDETNLVVTMLCARIFNIPTRIARVRNNELRDYPRILGEEGFEATSIIWPEQALVSYLTGDTGNLPSAGVSRWFPLTAFFRPAEDESFP